MKKIKPSHRLESVLKNFTENQLRNILKNVVAFQLTEGCSIGCYDCGVGAKKGVEDCISFDCLEWIFSSFCEELKQARPILYFASDPFDYNHMGHSYVDVHNAFEKNVGINPSVTTSVPKGMEETILTYFLVDNTLGNPVSNSNRFIDRISLTKMNYKRLEKVLCELFPRFDPKNQAKIKSRYDEDIEDSVRIKAVTLSNRKGISERLGINEEKIYIVENGKLYHNIYPVKDEEKIREYCNGGRMLFGIYLANGDWIFSGSPVSLKDLSSYSKSPFIRLDKSKNFGIIEYHQPEKGLIHVQKLGPRFTEELSSKPIVSSHGVLVKPDGFYNIRTVKPSSKYPYGTIVTPLDVNKPEIALLFNVSYGLHFSSEKVDPRFSKFYTELDREYQVLQI